MLLTFAPGCGTITGTGDDAGGDDDGGGGGDDAPPFTDGVSTLSGAADRGYIDGERGVARFSNPVNVAYGPDGKLYVADFDNHKIRLVDAETGKTSTVIDQMNFRRPFGLAFGPNGVLFVATDNNTRNEHDGRSGTIWKIDAGARVATVIVENIGRARGLTALADGRLAFSDYQSHVVAVVDPTTRQITQIAGSVGQPGYVDATGPAARFNAPYGIAQRADGKLVVADNMNHRLRLVGLEGTVSTLAGNSAGFADGAGASARFNLPQGVAKASNGDLYVTDLGNFRVRRVQGGTVSTVAGSGMPGFADNDDNLAAQLFGLEGLSLKPDASMLFVADGGRGEDVPFNRIRSVKL